MGSWGVMAPDPEGEDGTVARPRRPALSLVDNSGNGKVGNNWAVAIEPRGENELERTDAAVGRYEYIWLKVQTALPSSRI